MATIDKVNDIPPLIGYVGVNLQNTYAYPFPVFEEKDLVVTKDAVTLVIGVDYTLTGVTDDFGGDVVLNVPTVGGEILIFYRQMAIDRLTDYVEGGDFLAQTVNNDFDRIILMLQEIATGASGVTRSYRVSPADPTDQADLILPDAPTRQTTFFTFGITGAAEVLPFSALGPALGLAPINAGDGLTKFVEVDLSETLNVGAGTGLEVLADTVGLDAPTQLILSNVEYSGVGQNTNILFTGDVDTLIRNGFYNIADTAINLPQPVAGSLLTVCAQGNSISQRFTASLGNASWTRSSNGGVYNAWQFDLTQQNHDTVVVQVASEIVYNDFPILQYNNVQDGLAASLTAIGTRFNPANSVNIIALNVQRAIDQLDTLIGQALLGTFRGTWDATTNIPDIANDPTRVNGDYWIISVDGVSPLPGFNGGPVLDNWGVGDRALWGDDGINPPGWFQLLAPSKTLASQVEFDDVNFVPLFPGPIVAPTTAQEALDFGWPILENADFGGIGKQDNPVVTTDINLLLRSGFYYIDSTAPNAPIAENAGMYVIGINATTTVQVWTGTVGSQTYTRTQTAGAWSAWVAPGVPAGRTITAGAGLTGGGDLTTDRTFDIGAGVGVIIGADDIGVAYGATNITACVGDDARLSDARTPLAHTHPFTDITGVATGAQLPWALPTVKGGVEVELIGTVLHIRNA